MAKYAIDDCRNGSTLGKTVSGYPMFYKHREHGIMVAHSDSGRTRAEKRASKHFVGRKNTNGFPLGFNKNTWNDFCLRNAKDRVERLANIKIKGGN